MSSAPTNHWDPKGYEDRARFVREGGVPLVELLAPRAGERILDLGCGNGKLTEVLAASGASVLGVDASPEMLAEARATYPALEFALERGEALPYDAEFDAIFSNATLHWMPRANDVALGMARALRPGGRLVAELGGFENVATVRAAVGAGFQALGRGETTWNPWYFPTLGEYAAVLEAAGFRVRSARWFERPSPMPDRHGRSGIADWLSIFASELCEKLTEEERPRFFEAVEAFARARLYRDGIWWIDYVRLRVEATLPALAAVSSRGR
ncbi:MAG TPA: methyltransferase domain-containing protein [Polyangiaceae bacterium]|nr:methyltransferase domain-containing protein [Polyangiaceae bacterium]